MFNKVLMVISFVFLGLGTSTLSFAEPTQKLEKWTVKVNGMVCAFCAQGIEKALKANESIRDLEVNLDNKVVRFAVKDPSKVSDKFVEKAIVDSGFEVVKIEKNKE